MFQSSLCRWELFKFLLCKYWHTQWASATFCLSLSSSEAQYNNSLCWIYFFCIIFLNAPLSQLGGLKLPRTSRAATDCSPDTAQKFDKVTFCTFSTSSQECICCLIWGSILTLLNVLASGSGIVCQSFSGTFTAAWGQVGVPKQAEEQPEAANGQLVNLG